MQAGDLATRMAPDFTLPDQAGQMVTLSALRPRPVVLFFYPKDNTPTCTIEALDFSRLAPDFAAAGARLFGLSRDSVRTHGNFCRKQGLGLTLLSDMDGKVCEAYGVWQQKFTFGRHYMGIVRTTLLIDRAGRVARVWPEVSVVGHAAEVLDSVRGLT